MDRSLYNLHADLEDHYWWFLAKNRIVASLVRRYSPIVSAQPGPAGRQRSPDLCDVGCGGGGLLALLAGDFNVRGVEMDEATRWRARDRGLVVEDGSLPDRVPFPSGSFDVVVASEVIEHVADDQAAARRLAGLLRPGGVLVCTVPAHRWLWSSHDVLNHHHRRYTPRSLRAIFNSTGLEVVLCSQAMCALFPAVAAVRLAKRALGMDRRVREVKVRVPPAPINTVLRWLFEAEKWVLPYLALPMGSTVIAVFRRP